MYNVLSFATLLLSCYLLTRVSSPSGSVQVLLMFFLLLAAHIVVLGYVVSALNHLSEIKYWSSVGSVLTAIELLVIVCFRKLSFTAFPNPGAAARSLRNWYSEVHGLEKTL